MSLLFFIKKTIHRKLLEEELKKISDKISGRILDVGSKDARYADWFAGKVTAVDVIANPKKGVRQGNIYNLEFAPQTFECVLSTEVFEYLEDTQKALNEIYRVLAPGGFLVISVPLIYRVHEDLVRYTESFWRKLLGNFSKIEILSIGNFYTIILDIAREKIVKLPNRLLRYFLYVPLLISTFFIPLSVKLSKDKNFVSGYLIVARKQ